MSTKNAWTIIIYYTHSARQIEIVIPEFPSNITLLAFAIPTIIASIYKKKRLVNKH